MSTRFDEELNRELSRQRKAEAEKQARLQRSQEKIEEIREVNHEGGREYAEMLGITFEFYNQLLSNPDRYHAFLEERKHTQENIPAFTVKPRSCDKSKLRNILKNDKRFDQTFALHAAIRDSSESNSESAQ